jgi:DNA-binding winged helix-turn-helix (wHTH) protein/Tol biopolymer transport system component
VQLPPKAFDTLLHLVKHRDRTLTKDELLAMVWPNSYVTEESLTQNIFLLRRALGDDSDRSKFITTISRRGYRFVAEVNEVLDTEEPPQDRKSRPAEPHGEQREELRPPGQIPVVYGAPAGPELHLEPAFPVRRELRPRFLIAGALLLIGVAIAGLAMRKMDGAPGMAGALRPFRFSVYAPPGMEFASGGTVSPDARNLAFTAFEDRSDQAQVWLRPLDSAEARLMSGTRGASGPFWSPDSRFVGFLSNGELKRIAVGSGVSEMIVSRRGYALVSWNGHSSGTWNSENRILFNGFQTPLYSVSASGGDAAGVTSLDASAQEWQHEFPQFLPDGSHFLYGVASATKELSGTYVGSLGNNQRKRLLDVRSVYAWPGYLLYVREGVLMAQPFDASGLRLTGGPVRIASNVVPSGQTTVGGISASTNGVLAFTVSSATESLVWFNRAGQRLGAIEAPVTLRNPVLLASEKQILASGSDRNGMWLVNEDRATVMRMASDGLRPVPGPDGRIAFNSDSRDGISDIFLRRNIGSGEEKELLLRTNENKMVCDWSPDGRYLVYASMNPQTQEDLWLLPLFGDRKPIPYLRTSFNEARQTDTGWPTARMSRAPGMYTSRHFPCRGTSN